VQMEVDELVHDVHRSPGLEAGLYSHSIVAGGFELTS
jgi:hypothetical protein